MQKRKLGKSGLEVSAIGLGSRSQEGDTGADSLAWLLAQKPWIVPIPGTTKLHRIEENIGAAGLEFTAEDLAEINSAASQLTVTGERLPEPVLRMTGL